MSKVSYSTRLFFLIIFSNALFINYTFASGCNGYPFPDGLQISSVEGGSKFISTATVAMLFDDIEEELRLKKEARGAAKSAIVQFLNENVSTDEQIENKVVTQVNTDGQDLEKSKQIVKTFVSLYKNDAKGAMKGMLQIGDCTNPGEYVKVTVGLKPSTIAIAEETSSTLSGSVNSEVVNSNQETVSSQSESASNNGIAKSSASQNAQTDF